MRRVSRLFAPRHDTSALAAVVNAARLCSDSAAPPAADAATTSKGTTKGAKKASAALPEDVPPAGPPSSSSSADEASTSASGSANSGSSSSSAASDAPWISPRTTRAAHDAWASVQRSVTHHDDYVVAVACAGLIAVLWYWNEASYRKTRRLCETAVERAEDQLARTTREVEQVMARWEDAQKSREDRMVVAVAKNAEMAKKVDAMAVLLKRC